MRRTGVESPARRRLLAGAGAYAALGACCAGATDVGVGRMQLVVPQAPGGTADLLGRVLAERLEAALRLPVVVVNKPGANGTIANEYAAHAAPDGGTWLLASSATHVIAPHLIANPSVDPLRDFVPVINVAWQTKVITVSRGLGVSTLAELVAGLRAHPGRYNYGSTGPASTSHVDTAHFLRTNGLDVVHVPYRGSGQMVSALTTDEVQLLFASVTASLPAIQSGRARALAVLSTHHSPLLPAVPTIAEAGYPSTDLRGWIGVVAPSGTPQSLVDRVRDVLDRTVSSADFVSWLHQQGLEPIGGDSDNFARTIAGDFVRWGRIVRDLGLSGG